MSKAFDTLRDLFSLPKVELVDAGGIIDGLGGSDDIEADIAHADGWESTVYLVLAVAINHVEGLPFLLFVDASLQDAGAGDIDG